MYGDLPAIVCGERTLKFAEVVDRATRLGNALADAGCEPGDRIGVLLPNCAEYMEVDAGLAAAGVRARLAEHPVAPRASRSTCSEMPA